MRRTGLTVSNFFANGRKCLTEQNLSSLPAWVVCPGIIHPVIDSHTRCGGLASEDKILFPGFKRCLFMSEFCVRVCLRCQITPRFASPCL